MSKLVPVIAGIKKDGLESGTSVILFAAKWHGSWNESKEQFLRVSNDGVDRFLLADTDECQDLAIECDIRAVPTVAVLSDRNVVGLIIGKTSDKDMNSKIEELVLMIADGTLPPEDTSDKDSGLYAGIKDKTKEEK